MESDDIGRDSGLALDDFEERFATTVKLTLDALRNRGEGQPDGADDAKCPSADGIAAYYEDTLNRAERSYLEAHFSVCALCQGTLAALLRTAPAVEPIPETGRFAGRGRSYSGAPRMAPRRDDRGSGDSGRRRGRAAYSPRQAYAGEQTDGCSREAAQRQLSKSQTARDDQLALKEQVGDPPLNTLRGRCACGGSWSVRHSFRHSCRHSASVPTPSTSSEPCLHRGRCHVSPDRRRGNETDCATTAEPAPPSQAVPPRWRLLIRSKA